jgi:hypothetical protein
MLATDIGGPVAPQAHTHLMEGNSPGPARRGATAPVPHIQATWASSHWHTASSWPRLGTPRRLGLQALAQRGCPAPSSRTVMARTALTAGDGSRGESPSRGSEASSASGGRPGLLRGQATDPDLDGVEAKMRPTRQPRASRKWARTTPHSERCTNTLRHRVAHLGRPALSCSKKRAHHSGAMKLFLGPYNLTRAAA